MREVGPLATALDRLDAQGYVNVDRQTLRQVEPWLRWSPTFCTIVMTTGTILASPLVLWALAVTAALGTVMPSHPFDYVYNFGIRRLTGTPPLPANRAPRKFACGIAAVWLVATGTAFAADLTVLGYVLGGVLTAVAALVATTHFCIPSLIYGLIFGRPQCATGQP
jgi:hypothetical protein